MKTSLRIFSLILLTVTLLALNQETRACTCGPKEDVLTSLERSSNVFIAKIEAVEYAVRNVPKDSRKIIGASARISKVYQGDFKPGDLASFSSGVTSCSATFYKDYVGTEFLFYLGSPTSWYESVYAAADSPQKRFDWMFCNRSRSVESAKEDFRYLDNIDRLRGQTRISGYFRTSPFNVNQSGLLGSRIVLKNGDESTSLKISDDGYFDVFGLPPGKYTANLKLAAGAVLDTEYSRYIYLSNFGSSVKFPNEREIEFYLSPGRHVALYPIVRFTSLIRGKVLGPKGEPVKGVRVRVTSSSDAREKRKYGGDVTNEKGEFEVNGLPHGSFHIFANRSLVPTHEQPYKRTYFPSTTNESEASVVKVETGKSNPNITIRIAKFSETVEITGTLTDLDGKPVDREEVEFKSDKSKAVPSDNRTTRTDSQGRFRLRLLKGAKGIISANDLIYKGMCAKLDKFLDSKGVRTLRIQSNRINLTANKNTSDLQLRFQYSSCDK